MTITMSIVMHWFQQATLQAALLAVVIGCITFALRRWISPGARQALWLLVFVRLMMPALPASRFSIWGLHTPPEITSTRIEIQPIDAQNVQPLTTANTESKSIHDFVPSPAPAIWENTQFWIAVVWGLGAMIILGYAVLSTIRFSRAIRRTGNSPDATIASLIVECCHHARIRKPAAILTDQVATPALFGVFRPKLLLPPRIVSTLDPQSLRNVILHELEHLKRHHLAMDWLLTAIRAMHWFNPAAWWAHRQIRAARELICDQAVIASLSDADASRHYGHTLLTIASGALRSNEPSLVAAFARDQKLLRERIETIARTGKVKNIAGFGLLLTLILGMTFLTRPGRAQQAPPVSQPTTMPMMDVFKHPDNWPDLQHMRQPAQDQAANKAVYAALDRKLPEVRLDNVAFVDVIDYLRNVTSVNISVNWQALERAGVDRNTLVSFRLKDLKLDKVLDIILHDVGDKFKLDYEVNQGSLFISTEADLASLATTVLYDISDLVSPADGQDQNRRTDLINQLIVLLEDSVAPGSWKDRGGKIGTMEESKGQLIVTQSPGNQRKISQWMEQLRQTRGGGQHQAASQPQERPQAPKNQAINEMLEHHLPEVNLDGVPFVQAVDFLRNSTGIDIYVSWRDVEAAGVSRNKLITVHVRDVKCSDAINAVLASAGGDKARLAFAISDGVVMISTKDDLSSDVITRVYDLRDLIDEQTKDPQRRKERMAEIIKMIEDAVDPETWADHGGKIGSLRQLGDTAQLIITHNPESHQKIRQLLDHLREARVPQSRIKAQF